MRASSRVLKWFRSSTSHSRLAKKLSVLAAVDCGDPQLPVEYAVVKDLALFAIAYVLLHELQHVVFNSGRDGLSRQQEEAACDQFAVDQILGRATTWQPQHAPRIDPAKVMFKRSMGLLVGFSVLHRFTPPELRGEQQDYPSLATRLGVILNAITLPDDHPLWLFATTLVRELNGDSSTAVPSDSTQTAKANFVTLVEQGFR